MSVARVTILQDTGGNNPFNTQNLKRGVAKAFVRFTVAGTIEEAFNVASITKNSTGNWTIFFDEPMPTNKYALIIGGMATFNTHGGYGATSYTTTSVLVVNISAGLGSDVGVQVCVAVYGE